MTVDDYIVVDLEMTGLNPRKDRILEIGAVKVKGKRITETFSKLIRPNAALNPKLIELTGITDEEAASGDDLDVAVLQFLEFAEELTWVGHNIIFDYSFIKQWEINRRIKQTRYAVDTLKIARKCLPDLEKKTLDHLCGRYGIERLVRHRALEDAAANQEWYEKLEFQFINHSPDLFVKKELQYKAKRQTPATQRQKEWLMHRSKCYELNTDIPIEQLSRSEASRLMDRLILQYGKNAVLAGRER